MKRAVAGSLITALLVAGASIASATNEVVSVNVVGFQKLSIVGGTNAIYTLLSVPMTKIPVWRGTITANTSNTISDSTMNWTAGEFATNVSGKETYGKSTFFVEITSSNAPLVGRYFYIKTNSATTLTLVGSLGIADNALNTYSYKICAANRVRDVFGETNAPTLTGGGSQSTADNVFLWTPYSGWDLPIYFKTSGAPSTQRQNWIQNNIIVNDLVIERDEGMLVMKMAGGTTTNVTIAGEVSGNLQAIALEGTYNLIGGMSVVDVSIVNSGLTNVMVGGGSQSTADNIFSWTPGVGWDLPVYYKTSGAPSTQRQNWIQNNIIVNDTFILKAGQGYLIKKVAPNVWERNSPL